jgi:response regulator of citrate/malate metabolism
MATSLSDRDAVLDCLELGIQGYMVKPFTHKEITQRVLGYYQKTNPEKTAEALALLDALAADAGTADTEADATGNPA